MRYLLILVLAISGTKSLSQDPALTTPEKDFAHVFMIIDFLKNEIVYEKRLPRTPTITMPNNNVYMLYDQSLSSNVEVEFKDPAQVLNYMHLFGWKLIDSKSFPRPANLTPREQYVTIMYFERQHVPKK
ncbi:MAG TPA: hypothetical protein PKJ63_01525 [Cyclobacteriaceae bacterium]|nr:hypothetical protein [Cyclobacteriaceae bacterium]